MRLTFRQLHNYGKDRLQKNETEDADFEALQLLIAAADFKQVDFFLHSADIVSPDICDRYDDMLSQRISGRPLQYILGEWDFYKSHLYEKLKMLLVIFYHRDRSLESKLQYEVFFASSCTGCPKFLGEEI